VDLTIIEAVLFDMDGTLVDSDAAVERAWRVWAAEYGVEPAAVLAVAHGAPAERTVRLIRPDLTEAGVAKAAARQLALQYDDLSDVVPTPGAPELLAALRLPWAVVTSADARLAKARLGAAGIEAPLLVTVDDVRVGKPDPEGYLRAAELLGVAPAHCLVVEDAEVGVTAGRAAGAQVAALKGIEGDLPIPDLGTLARLLAGRDDPSA
jgi:sugar-phosphatase